MTICSHCGREAAPNNLYCQYCGQKLDVQPVAGQQAEPAPGVANLAQANDGVYYAAGPWMPDASEQVQSEALAAGMSAQSVQVATAVARGRLIVRSASTSEGQVGSDEREFILDERDVAIGRSPSCDIALSGDQLASRRHALLRFKNGHYTVVDLGSSNGTYVNDGEIREETTLQDGDYIKVGGHEILYSTGPASPHASLAGALMSMPLPATPLAETNPSVPAIDLSALAPLAPADEAGEASAVGEEIAGEPSAPAPESSETPAEAEASAEEAGTDEGALGEAGAVNFVLSDSGDASATAPTDDALDALRMQLSEIIAALTERASHDAAAATRLRAALREVRTQLASALAASPSTSDDVSTGELSELVIVARQAAENPRHLDYVTTLAARAGEIADALEARPAAEPDARLRATIEGLLARIDELLA